MRTDEVGHFFGIEVTTTRLTTILSLLIAATACTAERRPAPQPGPAPLTQHVSTTPLEPLLFVVDGVKYQRDQLPLITSDRIFAVRVIKGHAALAQYGKDASYGVVIITTRQAAGRQA
jgi:hypothetical protein